MEVGGELCYIEQLNALLLYKLRVFALRLWYLAICDRLESHHRRNRFVLRLWSHTLDNIQIAFASDASSWVGAGKSGAHPNSLRVIARRYSLWIYTGGRIRMSKLFRTHNNNMLNVT